MPLAPCLEFSSDVLTPTACLLTTVETEPKRVKMLSDTPVRGDEWMIQALTPVSVLVTAVVGVRVSLRISRHAGLWLDDWLILASLVFSWGMYAISILLVKTGGLGTPFKENMATDPSMAWLVNTLKVSP